MPAGQAIWQGAGVSLMQSPVVQFWVLMWLRNTSPWVSISVMTLFLISMAIGSEQSSSNSLKRLAMAER